MKIALFVKVWNVDFWIREIKLALPGAEVLLPEDITDKSEIDVAMVWKPNPGFLASLPNLKLICSIGAGVEFLFQDPTLPDLPIIRVINDNLTARMCEYILMQCLMHHRRMPFYARAQADRAWPQQPDPVAFEVRVGLLGLGVLGQNTAKLLQSVGYDVAGWSRSPKKVEDLETYHGPDGLDAMLARTDILVSLLPHTPQTEGILNYALFQKLARDGALGAPVVINAGRGKLQVEADIIKALDDGTLGGVSLDVFETEPLPKDSPLWSAPNTILTPHNAAVSDPKATILFLTNQIRHFFAGEPVTGIVDRKAGY